MPTNPYVILGISEDATQEEIEQAYKTKKAEYSDLIFEEGEVGSDAARKLEQIESAYRVVMENVHDNATVSDEPANYGDIRQAIKDKNPDKAQRLLDDITYRDGEWHYYQSIVFYEKSWLSDSKAQLEIALQLEPGNEKYQKALDNLKKKIDGGNPYNQNQQQTGAQQQENRTYTQPTGPDPVADGICTACQTLWCADCCCECMGGDLISCC